MFLCGGSDYEIPYMISACYVLGNTGLTSLALKVLDHETKKHNGREFQAISGMKTDAPKIGYLQFCTANLTCILSICED